MFHLPDLILPDTFKAEVKLPIVGLHNWKAIIAEKYFEQIGEDFHGSGRTY